MKEKILNILIGIGIFLLMTFFLPLYFVYSLFLSVIEAIYALLQGCADYFETIRDLLKGK